MDDDGDGLVMDDSVMVMQENLLSESHSTCQHDVGHPGNSVP